LEIINNINFKNQNDPLFIFYKPIFSLFINIHEDKLTMSHFLQIKNLINYFLNVLGAKISTPLLNYMILKNVFFIKKKIIKKKNYNILEFVNKELIFKTTTQFPSIYFSDRNILYKQFDLNGDKIYQKNELKIIFPNVNLTEIINFYF
jgi:hypothetical protein